MKLATARLSLASTTAVRLDGEEWVQLPYRDLGELLAWQLPWSEIAAMNGPRLPASALDFAPVVPAPDKIVCLGLNYASHIHEMGRPTPRYPTLFAKYRGALIGARDRIVLPMVSREMDWEAELGIVIGKGGRHIPRERALDSIAGYTVINDVTARDWQHRTREFLSGKTFEATTPVGPWLVTPDELPPGASGLPITCEVDGETVQKSTTSDLLFDVADIVSYLSQIITLLPGDLIATGTPGGVGAGRDPQVFLRSGQVLTTRIDGIGELTNLCIDEDPA